MADFYASPFLLRRLQSAPSRIKVLFHGGLVCLVWWSEYARSQSRDLRLVKRSSSTWSERSEQGAYLSPSSLGYSPIKITVQNRVMYCLLRVAFMASADGSRSGTNGVKSIKHLIPKTNGTQRSDLIQLLLSSHRRAFSLNDFLHLSRTGQTIFRFSSMAAMLPRPCAPTALPSP